MSLDIEAIKAEEARASSGNDWWQAQDRVYRRHFHSLIKEIEGRRDYEQALRDEVLTLRQSLHDLRNAANQSALALAEARMDLERVTGERDAILRWAFMLSDESKVGRVIGDEENWFAATEDGDCVTGDSAYAAIRKAAMHKANGVPD